MGTSAEILVDQEFLQIIKEVDARGRPAYNGRADLTKITEAEIREQTRDLGLILSFIDIPFSGEHLEWTDLHFVRREVPDNG